MKKKLFVILDRKTLSFVQGISNPDIVDTFFETGNKVHLLLEIEVERDEDGVRAEWLSTTE
jgi:hypothetical protein